MLGFLGEDRSTATEHAETILRLETELAKASKSRTDLRDPIANYHKFRVEEIVREYPAVPLDAYPAGIL